MPEASRARALSAQQRGAFIMRDRDEFVEVLTVLIERRRTAYTESQHDGATPYVQTYVEPTTIATFFRSYDRLLDGVNAARPGRSRRSKSSGGAGRGRPRGSRKRSPVSRRG